MKRKAVELTNVVKIFNKDIWALNGINLTVHFGDIIGIIGPRNSGKAVLGRILAGEVNPTLGKVYYGFDSTKNNNVGLQFRETSWPDGFRVKEIVALYKEVYIIDDEQWMEKLYNVFNIKEFLNSKISSLDPNVSQIFNLFLAIMCKPKFLIMESIPTSLGIDIRTNIIEFIKKYSEENKAAVVIQAPDGVMFRMLCNRVLLMNKGRVIADKIVDDIDKDKSYEDYLLDSLNYIKDNEEVVLYNPIYIPFIEKSDEYIELYKDLYKKYIEELFKKKKKFNKKSLLLINKWKNILWDINSKLKDLGSYLENDNNHNSLKKYIKQFNKNYKLTKLIHEKIHHSENEKITKFLEKAEPIAKFILEEINGFENVELTKDKSAIKSKEYKELEKYKKKIIHEEEKMLKQVLEQQEIIIKENNDKTV